MIVKTGYSFKSAIGKLTDVISRLQELNCSTIAVADTNSTYSFTKLTKLCSANNLKVVYGAELGVCWNPGSKRPGIDRWIFLAKNNLRDLHEAVYLGTKDEKRDPFMTYEKASNCRNLIKIMGPAVNLERLEKDGIKPQADLFFGLSPAMPRALARRLLALGYAPLALSWNRYPQQEDIELYRLTLGSGRPGKGNASTQTYPQHILSDDEWCNALAYIGDEALGAALINRDEVLASCNASMKTAKLIVPEKPKSLLNMCYEGAQRIGCDLSSTTYAERLGRELQVIYEKNFEDYFYVVADMMQYARKHMIVGPARGSSGGSLVCYLLGITAIDPIKYDLVFERFIDITRSDLPDIDVDLSDVNREIVFEYMRDKYGLERVARLGSVNTFKAKAVLNHIGPGLRIPQWQINDFASALIKRPDGDPRFGCVIQDTFEETVAGQQFLKTYPEARIAERMEDHPASAGQHAAGVVLTDEPIMEYVAINGGTRAVMCDKRDAETLNLLKIDALGLSQLSVFERCLKKIGHEHERNLFLEALPINDRKALDVLNEFKYSGIFQFVPGAAVNAYVQQLRSLGGHIESVEDICALTALVRPGPLGSGATDAWIKRRAGKQEITYAHPSLEPILSKTMGVITYQEQILAMGRQIAGLSWEDVTGIRKAIGKKMGSLFAEYGSKWREGAHSISGISYELADKIWNELKEHGSYSFNRSHAMAYGLVSYYCCYLKAYYPLEFAAATLDSHSDPQNLIEILRELRAEGVKYIAVDPAKSERHWTIVEENSERVLLGPIQSVNGVGPKAVLEVEESRRKSRPLNKKVSKKFEPPKTKIDSLDPIRDAFNVHLAQKNITTKPKDIGQVMLGEKAICVYCVVEKVKQINENDPAIVAKRGYEFKGNTLSVGGWIRDDSGKIYFKLDSRRPDLVKEFIERARPGKTMFAIKGWCPQGFRMIKVDDFRYVGEIDT